MPIEDFVLIEVIGKGSFGKVHKARHKATGTIVAMKFIEKRQKKEKEIQSIRREIEILTHLQHENIICMYDAFETENEFVVVMEFARGELFDVLEDDKTLPEPEVRNIAKQLVRALHYLHMNRVIHRDMKPQNILLSSSPSTGKNGIVKLCDFGFARTMSQQTIVLTSIKGTPLYMAPELVQEQPYNQSVDLWSLGCILYELYYGKPPFFTQNIYALIDQIKKDPVNFPEPISPEFKSFLRGLLTKNAAQRLNWSSGLLAHPFAKDSPEDSRERGIIVAQQRGVRQKLETLGLIRIGRQFVGAGDQQLQFNNNNSNIMNISNSSQQQQQQNENKTRKPFSNLLQVPNINGTTSNNNNLENSNNNSARVSLRNSISMKMERGFNKSVLDIISNCDRINTGADPTQIEKLTEALQLAEQSTMTAVINPLHSSIFLARLSQEFFSKLVSCLTQPQFAGRPIVAHALSLLRLFLHPEGSASISSFPSRAISDSALSLLRLRSECRIELRVRQMAKQAVIDANPSSIKVLLELASLHNINDSDLKGHALAVLLQIARGNPEGLAVISTSNNFVPCVKKLFEQKIFSMKNNINNANVQKESINNNSIAAAANGNNNFYTSPSWTWRPVAVYFLSVITSCWIDLNDIVSVVNTAVDDFLISPAIHSTDFNNYNNYNNNSNLPSPTKLSQSFVANNVSNTAQVVKTAAAAAAAAAATTNTTTTKQTTNLPRPSMADLEISYRSALCSVMYSAISASDERNSQCIRQQLSHFVNNSNLNQTHSFVSDHHHHHLDNSNNNNNNNNNNCNMNNSKVAFQLGNDHIDFILSFVKSMLSRARFPLISCRPCGTLFGLPDVGLLDDAVKCLTAIYRSSIISVDSENNLNNNNNTSQNNNSKIILPIHHQQPVAAEVTARLHQNSGFPFFEADRGSFSVLVAVLYAGCTCDHTSTLPGFDLSPSGVQSLIRGFTDALNFQLHFSGTQSVSCMLESAQLALLPPPTVSQHQHQNNNNNNNNNTQFSGVSASTVTTRFKNPSYVAISMILSILSPEWLQSMELWPSESGGGLLGARATIHTIIDLLVCSHTTASTAIAKHQQKNNNNSMLSVNSTTTTENILIEDAKRVAEAIEQHLLKERIIGKLFDAIDRLGISERGPAFHFLMRLVTGTATFCDMFVQDGGLEGNRLQALLQPHSPCRGDALTVLCHLSRGNKDSYPLIEQSGIYSLLLQIVQRDASETLRGRVCNLVGNLCKHNPSLTPSLKQSGLIAEMANRCWINQEPDDGVRKFACFAIGNAAFHNDFLYKDLAGVVPALVQLLLQSSDDKARQNAAGAIGNLVRNGTSLAATLNQHHAAEALISVFESQDSSLGLKRNVIFSLGTLAQAAECKDRISVQRLHQSFQKYSREIQSDAVFAKYVARLKQKLPGL